MHVFSVADHVQHMMFRYLDPERPSHDEAASSAKTLRFFGREIAPREAIATMYEEIDRLCREVYERHLEQDPDGVLLILSDHGCAPFRRKFHLQNWLLDEGYLVLRPEGEAQLEEEPGKGGRPADGLIFSAIDWSRTRAYSLGLGKVYINRADREHVVMRESGERIPGCVSAEECGPLLQELRTRLLAVRDEGGAQVLHAVYPAGEIFQGAHWSRCADLYLGFARGYRIAWADTLGELTYETDERNWRTYPALEDNRSPWSGDHASVDPSLVPGVFFSNRRFRAPAPARCFELLHIAPTLLDLVGVDPSGEMDRAPLVLNSKR
jgi:predicted AlkP superfamily phosphohydrolase/phosphomutase